MISAGVLSSKQYGANLLLFVIMLYRQEQDVDCCYKTFFLSLTEMFLK